MSKLIQKLAVHFEKQLKKIANSRTLELIWNDLEALEDYTPENANEAQMVSNRIRALKAQKPQTSNKLTPEEEAKINSQLDQI